MECTSSTVDQDVIASGEIIQHLIQNKEIYFKSQQIDEDDLSLTEKENIAKTLLESNPTRFLSQFGKYLKLEHMSYFKQLLNDSASNRLLNYHYKNLIRFHTKSKHSLDVRNRRFEALKKLIAEESYFSEKEMMKRNPLLYEQLVGKYLSEKERKMRDRYSKNEMSLIGLLMDGIEKDLAEQKKKEQQSKEYEDGDSSSGSTSNKDEISKSENVTKMEWNKLSLNKQENFDNIVEEDTDEDEPNQIPYEDKFEHEEPTPTEDIVMETEEQAVVDNTPKKFIAFRISGKKLDKTKKPIPVLNKPINHKEIKHKKKAKNYKIAEQYKKWGESQNMETSKPWREKNLQLKMSESMISTKERNMLKEEFVSLMYQSFLDGEDDFDYSTVDNNEEYDDNEIIDQDAEDKYFEEDSSDEQEDIKTNIVEKTMESSSEDELDAFMERLNQHPTVWQLAKDLKKL